MGADWQIVMLGDFGLSKQLRDTFDMAKTPIGTPYYMVRLRPSSTLVTIWCL